MKRFLARTLAAATAVLVLGGLGALGASDITPNDLIPKDRTTQPEERTKTGDDNRDGRIEEDESGWDCAAMGNRQCGPGAHLPRY
ncbi:hypothetical protein ACIP93_33625 [Streptomyces sp. NPDC088745]|uniref:hypothetical protein n=1 Tax=Streptomyces sp. NPDC088745 TaxID=3365884 RepID=UPI003828A346